MAIWAASPSLLQGRVVDDPCRRLPDGAVVEGGHRLPDGGRPYELALDRMDWGFRGVQPRVSPEGGAMTSQPWTSRRCRGSSRRRYLLLSQRPVAKRRPNHRARRRTRKVFRGLNNTERGSTARRAFDRLLNAQDDGEQRRALRSTLANLYTLRVYREHNATGTKCLS
jgi:hypothetical protein